ncbi:hypothetical protein HMPREF0973_03018 [Prevotella veroralis F0319]|uniref:Uncharacterized protein n=1 Tax=Prevotella veroralis F0319 TaxID=649761 RepID=C9MTP0_9BACT|nr:hypothetical protein HMPREF0973_03018 [Prevotella veroralis F0319]
MPDLGKRQYARITVMLQGALADVEQLAHISVVQPFGMFTLFSKCPVAGLGKGKYLVPQHCPLLIGNDKISHSVILIYLYFPFAICFPSHISACKSMRFFPICKAVGNSEEE